MNICDKLFGSAEKVRKHVKSIDSICFILALTTLFYLFDMASSNYSCIGTIKGIHKSGNFPFMYDIDVEIDGKSVEQLNVAKDTEELEMENQSVQFQTILPFKAKLNKQLRLFVDNSRVIVKDNIDGLAYSIILLRIYSMIITIMFQNKEEQTGDKR